ncbi:UNVERIFIED_CONTAM: hypothetical protein HDU68_003875 [Siphonaria sp. JEL0065]|nr:hypothetical protein HDU68_003875 [Siphonaria sp. JEL0065]
MEKETEPVALASIHLIGGIVGLSRVVGAVNWCGTNPLFQRKGHAKTAMAHAIQYVVEECGCEEVYLTAIEEGPENLYKSLGFEVVEEVIEWQFRRSN